MSENPPATQFKFSADELRILEQCNKESFYQRCIPLATILGVGTYYGIKSGRILSNPRFGAIPKVFSAVVIGYLLGKLSYQRKCAEKFMAVPHSRIGAMLRSKAGGRYDNIQETLETEHPDPNTLYGKVPSSDFYSDVKLKSHMDIDTDRPSVSGLDDSFRPSVDDDPAGLGPTTVVDEELPPQTSHSTTYEELRKKNREEFVQKKTKPYRGIVTPEDVPSALEARDYSQPNDTWSKPNTRKPTNIYGDIFEK